MKTKIKILVLSIAGVVLISLASCDKEEDTTVVPSTIAPVTTDTLTVPTITCSTCTYIVTTVYRGKYPEPDLIDSTTYYESDQFHCGETNERFEAKINDYARQEVSVLEANNAHAEMDFDIMEVFEWTDTSMYVISCKH